MITVGWYLFTFYVQKLRINIQEKIKTVRIENDTEYCNKDIKDYFIQRGIKQQLTAFYMPQQNGVAERYNRTIMEK